MPTGRLARLADEIAAHGVDVGEIRALQPELDAIETGPGRLRRLSARARRAALAHWGHVVAELRESREAVGLVARRLRGDPLSDEDADRVRGQMLDLLRVVPAGLIAATNAALPLPGTSLVTPWLLARLGLMPSRWREAHLLSELRRERDRLEATGHATEAHLVDDVLHDLEAEADARDEAQRQAALLTHWDANRNGVWDADERAAYEAELAKVRALVAARAAQKTWFLQLEGQVFGPVRMSRFRSAPRSVRLLVCCGGRSGWVELERVLDG